jgi:hypothetical protein
LLERRACRLNCFLSQRKLSFVLALKTGFNPPLTFGEESILRSESTVAASRRD